MLNVAFDDAVAVAVVLKHSALFKNIGLLDVSLHGEFVVERGGLVLVEHGAAVIETLLCLVDSVVRLEIDVVLKDVADDLFLVLLVEVVDGSSQRVDMFMNP
jgi:hypothetical protein